MGREFGQMPRKETGEWRVLEVPGSLQEGQASAGRSRESRWNLRTSLSSFPPPPQFAECSLYSRLDPYSRPPGQALLSSPLYRWGKLRRRVPKSLTLALQPVKNTSRSEPRSQSPKPRSPGQGEVAEACVSLIRTHIFFFL